MTGAQEDLQRFGEAVLQSETFRNAPSSRRLLKYFLDRALAGDVDAPKEYTIGVDAFGKPAGYDPRQDSTVRIQVGRLRQKLAEYYAGEGGQDVLVLDLPKGKLKLVGLAREDAAVGIPEQGLPVEPHGPAVMEARSWWTPPVILGACLVVVAAVSSWVTTAVLRPRAQQGWSAELEEIWAPFVGRQPLLVSVGDPLFLQFKNKLLFRDPSIESWQGLRDSAQVEAIDRAINGGESRPVHYYAAVGDVNAAFLLGQRLGPRQPSISLVRSSQLLWQQMANSNVLFLGPPRFFGDRLNSLPVTLEIAETPEGFQVLHPRPGDAERYGYREPAGYFSEDGEACVLVTRAPGPAGNTNMLLFASNSTFGRAGAVDAFTEPRFAKMLAGRMRNGSREIGRYFQVLLRVKFKGGVPTETTYILHRDLKRRDSGS